MNGKAMIHGLMLLMWLISIGPGHAQDRWIDPRCTVLPFATVSPLAELRDGRLLMVQGNATRTSKDDGKTWSEPRKIYDGPAPGVPCESCVLVRARAGALVLVYMDMSTYKWAWDAAKGEAAGDVRLDVWSIRSTDQGKTWTDRQKLLSMIQTKAGQIVVPIQLMLRDRTRHATRAYVSADEGKTWKRGNLLDLGGYGDHDGAMEATLAELSDGRLMMLLRTNLDRFWEAYSEDQGLYWRTLRPSPIDASSAPGYLIRLASGRLALVWNRLYPEGKQTTARRGGGSLSETKASWHREELSLALSQDDGKTWTKPAVIARRAGGGLSYPYVFERRPGELWVITRYSVNLCLQLREADFIGK